MVAGPLLVIGGLIALFVLLGAPFTASTFWVIVGIIGAVGLWRLSVWIAPEKKCWHCDGAGARPGLLGGLRACDYCKGSGRIPRMGAK
jgi:hypothetical protein